MKNKFLVFLLVAVFLNSFNVFEGVPSGGNKYLVTDILKKKWGFSGIVVSDWASFGEMIAHGYAADEKDAALKAILAGSDMDMEAHENSIKARLKDPSSKKSP